MSAHPAYHDNVLKLELTLAVTLAQTKIPVASVVRLAPGSFLTFAKHHTEPLQVEAGGRAIATGEAVKIGDKFGVRILDIPPPQP